MYTHRLLPTQKNRISWRLDKEIRKSLLKLIEKRTRENSSAECSNNDLLELMIKAAAETATATGCLKETTTTNCSSKNSAAAINIISANDIVEECKTIFFAGKHTTSNLLTWTTILLAMHPQWQELAREEVLSVCGSRDAPTLDDLAKLKTVSNFCTFKPPFCFLAFKL